MINFYAVQLRVLGPGSSAAASLAPSVPLSFCGSPRQLRHLQVSHRRRARGGPSCRFRNGERNGSRNGPRKNRRGDWWSYAPASGRPLEPSVALDPALDLTGTHPTSKERPSVLLGRRVGALERTLRLVGLAAPRTARRAGAAIAPPRSPRPRRSRSSAPPRRACRPPRTRPRRAPPRPPPSARQSTRRCTSLASRSAPAPDEPQRLLDRAQLLAGLQQRLNLLRVTARELIDRPHRDPRTTQRLDARRLAPVTRATQRPHNPVALRGELVEGQAIQRQSGVDRHLGRVAGLRAAGQDPAEPTRISPRPSCPRHQGNSPGFWAVSTTAPAPKRPEAE